MISNINTAEVDNDYGTPSKSADYRLGGESAVDVPPSKEKA